MKLIYHNWVYNLPTYSYKCERRTLRSFTTGEYCNNWRGGCGFIVTDKELYPYAEGCTSDIFTSFYLDLVTAGRKCDEE